MTVERVRGGLKYEHVNDIKNKLRTKVLPSLLSTKLPPPYTYNDLIRALVPADDVRILKRASEISNVSGYYRPSTALRNILVNRDLPTLTVSTDADTGMLTPKRLDWQHDTDDVRHEMEEWARHRLKYGEAVSEIFDAVKRLIEQCNYDPRKVRYVWPSIRYFAEEHWGPCYQKITEYKVPKELPGVHKDVGEWLDKGAQLVTLAEMIPSVQGGGTVSPSGLKWGLELNSRKEW